MSLFARRVATMAGRRSFGIGNNAAKPFNTPLIPKVNAEALQRDGLKFGAWLDCCLALSWHFFCFVLPLLVFLRCVYDSSKPVNALCVLFFVGAWGLPSLMVVTWMFWPRKDELKLEFRKMMGWPIEE